jgi:signal transduction histidine kinase
MRPLSLRVRLTLWYVLALVAVLVVCGVVVRRELDRIAQRRIDRELAGQAQTIVNVMEEEFQEKSPMLLAATVALQAVAQRERAFAVFDDKGTVIAERLNGLQVKLPDLIDGPVTWTAYGDFRPQGWRVRAQESRLSGGQVIVVAGSPIGNARAEAQEAMLVAFPIVLLVAGLGGLWLASIGLRPITAMADQASKIPLAGLQDLGESGRGDELGTLARAFNGLLARLRSALAGQRRFMADASHELRTPLSVMRSAADVTLSQGIAPSGIGKR